jgi:superfamily I DNA/RNA helicase
MVHLRDEHALDVPDDDLNYLLEELDWIRDQGLTKWKEYADIVRRGRERRLLTSQRREIWQLLHLYRESMRRHGQFDWAEVPLMMLEGMAAGRIPQKVYHAILVDEAQDFAPSWFEVAQRMLRPSTNMLFIVSDAAQKIYRRPLSWRALGIDVTGHRSRVLRRSYRNTYEILRVAYELVGDDEALAEELRGEGDEIVRPEMDGTRMRRGPVPTIVQFDDPALEMEYIASEIKQLIERGYALSDVSVIHRETGFLQKLAAYLRSQEVPVQVTRGINIDLATPDVKLVTLHSSKGLEFSVVFVAGVERLQSRPGLTAEEMATEITEMRRLLYVGMTRAREQLRIMHAGPLPGWVASTLETLRESHAITTPGR